MALTAEKHRAKILGIESEIQKYAKYLAQDGLSSYKKSDYESRVGRRVASLQDELGQAERLGTSISDEERARLGNYSTAYVSQLASEEKKRAANRSIIDAQNISTSTGQKISAGRIGLKPARNANTVDSSTTVPVIKATLIRPDTGEKVVVDSGSASAKLAFEQGYKLMGPDGKPVPEATQTPETAPGQAGGTQTVETTGTGVTTPPRPILSFDTKAYADYQPTETGAEPAAPSLEQIRQEQIAAAEKVIADTQAQYDAEIARLSRAGLEQEQIASSYAVGAGLAASPFQRTMEAKQRAETERVVQAKEAERKAYVSEVMANAEANAQSYYQAAWDRYRAELGDFKDERAAAEAERKAATEANQKAAKETLKNLAAGGYSVDDLDPTSYRAMLDATGYSDMEARAVWAMSTPEANASYSVQDGMLVQTYFDPVTGKPVVRAEAVPGMFAGAEAPSMATVEFGGNVYWYDKNDPVNADGSPKLMPLGSQKGPEDTAAGGGMGELTPTQASAIRKEIASDAAIQQFSALNSTYNSMAALYEQASAMGDDQTKAQLDQAMITLFNKMLDPNSVVREGEYARTLEGQKLLAQVQGWYERLVDGGAGITDEARAAMVDAANTLFEGARSQYDNSVSFYSGVLREYGADPSLFIKGVGTLGTTGSAGGGPSFSQTYADPDEAVVDFPELSSVVDNLRGENYSDNEIVQFLNSEYGSFSGDPGKSENGPVGTLSEKYESGGDPGAIGYDSTGGYSYGAYQLAHRNALVFAEKSPYADRFKGLAFNSKEWRDRWKTVAREDPEGFKEAQRKYIEETHYLPQAEYLASKGIDLSKYSPVLRDVVWSTAVQHGPRTDVIAKAFEKAGKDADEASVIRAIYDERWGGGKRFAGSTEGVRKSVYNRFFGKGGELETVLSMIG